MSFNPNFKGSGNVSVAKTTSADFINNSGSSLNKGVPVRLDINGELMPIDPSIEAHVSAIAGIVSQSISDNQSGSIINSGRLEDFITSATIGSPLYLAKDGSITDVKPSIGVGGFVEGDFAVLLGIVAKNTVNPANKDLLIRIQLIGQL